MLCSISRDVFLILVEFDVFTISFLYGKNITIMHFLGSLVL